jgi:hypothetical protein
MSQNNLNRLIAELREERNRLRAAEAAGGAGAVSANNINRQITELERRRNGNTRSYGSPPRNVTPYRKRPREGRSFPNTNNHYNIPFSPGNNLAIRQRKLEALHTKAWSRKNRFGWAASVLEKEKTKKKTQATKKARTAPAEAAQLRANANKQERAAKRLREVGRKNMLAITAMIRNVVTSRRKAITKTRPPGLKTPTPPRTAHKRFLEGERRRAFEAGNKYAAKRMTEQLNALYEGRKPYRFVNFNLTLAPTGRESNPGGNSNNNASVGNKNNNKK